MNSVNVILREKRMAWSMRLTLLSFSDLKSFNTRRVLGLAIVTGHTWHLSHLTPVTPDIGHTRHRSHPTSVTPDKSHTWYWSHLTSVTPDTSHTWHWSYLTLVTPDTPDTCHTWHRSHPTCSLTADHQRKQYCLNPNPIQLSTGIQYLPQTTTQVMDGCVHKLNLIDPRSPVTA